MKIFKLPDLGEGLPDAQIREWYVKVGDTVKVDQPLVAMETAKALVDVPAPFASTIEKLFGTIGETINTGDPLIGFVGEDIATTTTKDNATVVGKIETSEQVLAQHSVNNTHHSSVASVTPNIRALARRLGVDLQSLISSHTHITEELIRKTAVTQHKEHDNTNAKPLSPMQRAMVLSMQKSHAEVVPVTLTDVANIDSWFKKQDLMIRVIQAIIAACRAEPILNSHFNGKALSYQLNEQINIGIAIDTAHGLYVPVIKNAESLSEKDLRAQINTFKEQAEKKSLAQQDLHGATILLSNFGSIAGRFANPTVIPPTVTIVGIGRIYQEAKKAGESLTLQYVLPISLSVDHRLVTGGETARFLHAMIQMLEK